MKKKHYVKPRLYVKAVEIQKIISASIPVTPKAITEDIEETETFDW